MKIFDFLSKKAIKANLVATSKEDTIKELVDLLIAAGEIVKKDRSIFGKKLILHVNHHEACPALPEFHLMGVDMLDLMKPL